MTADPVTKARAALVRPIERVGAAGLAFACLSLLIVANQLEPDAAGHGTHTQLGLTPCGWMIRFGKPCPTCGMTTSVAHAADGDLISAAATQPAGTLFALCVAACFWGSLHVAATGSQLGRVALRMVNRWTAGVALLAVAAAWVYTLSRA